MDNIEKMKNASTVEELDKLFQAIKSPTYDELETYENLRASLLKFGSIMVSIEGNGLRYLIKHRREELPATNVHKNPIGKPVKHNKVSHNIPMGNTYGIYYPKLVNGQIQLQEVNKNRDLAEIEFDIAHASTVERNDKNKKFSEKILPYAMISENFITDVENYTVVATNLISPATNMVEWTIYSFWQEFNGNVIQLFFSFEDDSQVD